MKEIMYLLISLVVCFIVILIFVFWDRRTKGDNSGSELHARDRYAVAEKINQELKDKHRSIIPEKWAKSHTKNYVAL